MRAKWSAPPVLIRASEAYKNQASTGSMRMVRALGFQPRLSGV